MYILSGFCKIYLENREEMFHLILHVAWNLRLKNKVHEDENLNIK